MGKTVADYPHLVAEWHPTKNGDLKPEDVLAQSNKKRWWKCYSGTWPDGLFADDHEWESTVVNRTINGNGCSCCRGRTVVASNCLAITHPELAKEWHPTKNGGLTPYDVVPGSHKKIWWKCYKGAWPDGSYADDHEWSAKIKDRSKKGYGCPYCFRHQVALSNCFATTHPELANKWHPTKNEDLTPYDVVAGSNKKVWWKCYEGTWPDGTFADDHEWEAWIQNRTGTGRANGVGKGCPFCSNYFAVPSNCLAATHPKLVKEWHPTKNGGLTPHDVVAGSVKSIWWKCYKGAWPDGSYADDHEWIATPVKRAIVGSGCHYCAHQKVSISNCLATTHPELAKEWHTTKNRGLTPYDVVAGGSKRVWWKCSFGHDWVANLSNRLKSGCPRCSESRGEKEIARILDVHSIQYRRQQVFKSCRNRRPLSFDFVVHHKRRIFLVEYQGEQHYRPVGFGASPQKTQENFERVQIHDTIKRTWCREKGCPLLEIPYWEFDNIEKLVMEFIEIPGGDSYA